jgi:RNA recognition motif-containing protein
MPKFDLYIGIHKINDTVYINNLPQDVTEEKLAAHFGSIGIIKTDKKLKKPKSMQYLCLDFT